MGTANVERARQFSAATDDAVRVDDGALRAGDLLNALCGLDPHAWLAIARRRIASTADVRALDDSISGISGWDRWSIEDDITTALAWSDPQGRSLAGRRTLVRDATRQAAYALMLRSELGFECSRRLLGGFDSLVSAPDPVR